MAHTVVLGAGIGGMPGAYELREVLDKEHVINVVNANEYYIGHLGQAASAISEVCLSTNSATGT